MWGRGTHSCLEVVWKLPGKCLVLDGGLGRRVRVSGVCQEVVWKVSGVINEKPKPATGRPLAGLLHWALQGGLASCGWGVWTLGWDR